MGGDGREIEALIGHLKGLGEAMATTSSGGVFDVGRGRIGLADGHEELLLEHLAAPIGSLVVRVFDRSRLIPVTHAVTGKTIRIPEKSVYGYALERGRVRALTAARMRDAHTTDARTGARKAPEPGVRFVDAPDLGGMLERIG
jgi:hypothetical protein